MGLLLVLLGALLAGCAEPPAGTVTVPLDVPAARFLLPRPDALPPDYRPLGAHAHLPPWPGIHDAHEVLYANVPARQHLGATAWVFLSVADAEAAFHGMPRPPHAEATPLDLGDNAEGLRSAEGRMLVAQVVVQDGPVAWMLVHYAVDEEALATVDLEEMARGLIARARAHAAR